jgi:hypothetical protein
MINLKFWLMVGAAAAVLAGVGGLYLKGRHDEATKLKPVIVAAKAQSQADQATIQAVDHYTHEITVIHDRSERAQRAVEKAPGADQPLPADVRSRWLAGLSIGSPEGAPDNPAKP